MSTIKVSAAVVQITSLLIMLIKLQKIKNKK